MTKEVRERFEQMQAEMNGINDTLSKMSSMLEQVIAQQQAASAAPAPKKTAKKSSKKSSTSEKKTEEYTQVDGKVIKVTPEQKEYLENRRQHCEDYKAGKIKKRTDAQKTRYNEEYARRWELWRKSGKHTSDENKKHHKELSEQLRNEGF